MQDKAVDKAKFRRESLQLQRLAFVAPILWEISWLSYPLVVLLVRRRRRAKGV